MNIDIVRKKINEILIEDKENQDKAERLVNKLEEKINDSNIYLIFQDLIQRNKDEYLNSTYMDLWIGIAYDPDKKYVLLKFYKKQKDSVKLKVKEIFKETFNNFKDMYNNGAFNDLDDFENPYKVIEEFYKNLD